MHLTDRVTPTSGDLALRAQQSTPTADYPAAMSQPRNLYSGTTVFVTCPCVHQSYRLVPTAVVRRVVDYCFAVVSMRYRLRYGMKFYEFEFLSSHYHLVACNACGRITDFLQDLNALIARELNAVRGRSGAFFDREPGIQTVHGEDKVFEHCVYTLANAVAAGIVRSTKQWKGSNSRRLEYGKEYVVVRPRVGLWSKKVQHKHRRSSQRSGRAAFAQRCTLPETAVLMLDRPPIMPELSDAQLRARIRGALEVRERPADSLFADTGVSTLLPEWYFPPPSSRVAGAGGRSVTPRREVVLPRHDRLVSFDRPRICPRCRARRG